MLAQAAAQAPSTALAKSGGPHSIAIPVTEALDRRTALLTQHMAAFGALAGEAEWQSRERAQPAHFDYFA